MEFWLDEDRVKLTTWREKLVQELHRQGEKLEDIVFIYPSETVLDIPFDGGFGAPEGPMILVFTTKRVYFPITYDGAEWIGSAPRHPEHIQDGDGKHLGGW